MDPRAPDGQRLAPHRALRRDVVLLLTLKVILVVVVYVVLIRPAPRPAQDPAATAAAVAGTGDTVLHEVQR